MTVYTTNNTVLMLDSIGDEDEEALICRTDLNRCCKGPQAVGEWFYPNGTRVPKDNGGYSFYRNRGAEGQVYLRRRHNVLSPLGTYCCEVPTSNGDETLCVILSKFKYIVCASTGKE